MVDGNVRGAPAQELLAGLGRGSALGHQPELVDACPRETVEARLAAGWQVPSRAPPRARPEAGAQRADRTQGRCGRRGDPPDVWSV
jgi:hypothetical protein